MKLKDTLGRHGYNQSLIIHKSNPNTIAINVQKNKNETGE